MKIRTKKASIKDALSNPKSHNNPVHQSAFWRHFMCILSKFDLKAVNFSYSVDIPEAALEKPCLFLMNHSSFIDLEIVSTLLRKHEYHIICTNDGFVGKEWLMSKIGCIPTKKFIPDIQLIKDMTYTVKNLNSSVVMFPEASYSFDGSTTPLPESLGKCIKYLNIPVVMIKTTGAFLRDPLYNCLQKRRVPVNAHMYQLFSTNDIQTKSVEELNCELKLAFSYDHFRNQFDSGTLISEKFRADGLERVLYKCPACKKEGSMKGQGITIKCNACKKEYTLLEIGKLKAQKGGTEYEYITDWYNWERNEIKKELLCETYSFNEEVTIRVLTNFKAIYEIGTGRLIHDINGFHLISDNGEIDFSLKPKATYSVYADFFWYELGDMISIGDNTIQYYCFPTNQSVPVAKVRLATEELYKINA